MTAQEIEAKVFEKAVFGGYAIAGVDSFLDQVAAEFTALNKENQDLKRKLKVLVAKIDEYRATEDAMRAALLSAQKMSTQITDEAKANAEATTAEAAARAEALLTEAKRRAEQALLNANVEANRILSAAKGAVSTEEAALATAKRSTAQYVKEAKWLCNRLMSVLDNPGTQVEVAEPEPAQPEPVQAEPAAEPEPEAPEAPVQQAEPQPRESDTVRSIESYLSAMSGTTPADSVDEPTRQFSFGAVFGE